MASASFNEGMKQILAGTIVFTSGTFRIMFVKTSYTFDKTDTVINTATTGILANEINATGWTQGYGSASHKALGTKTVTISDGANKKVKFSAADPTAWTLGGATNDTIKAAIVYYDGGSAGASVPVWYLEPSSSLTTNGSNVQVNFDSTLGLYTSTV